MRGKLCRVLLSVLAVLISLPSSANDEPESILKDSFEAGTDGWRNVAGRVAAGEGMNGGACLKFTIDQAQANADAMASRPLDVARLRGKSVLVEAFLKAQDLTKPKVSYFGPKLMLSVQAPNEKNWPDQQKKYGTYDWMKCSVFARIPVDATEVVLSVGMQGCTGTLWVDDVTISILPMDMPEPDLSLIRSDRSAMPRMRGVMSGHSLQEEDLRVLGQEWGANLLRYQLSNFRHTDVSTPEKYRAWLDQQLTEMDRVLPLCRKYGIQVLIDLHAGPSNKQDELLSNRLAWDAVSQQVLVDVWKMMGARYKDHPEVWGYDILNEPREEDYVWSSDGGEDWNHLALRIATALRAADPVKPIVIEPAMWGGPRGFRYFKPVNVSNVIYSVHVYGPGEFTHQGVGGRAGDKHYPDTYGDVLWNREQMLRELAPVLEFQKKYQVPIYVGEFSVARWAPQEDALRWLGDLISIMEENQWDWSYHAFRESDCWDAEMGTARADKTRKKSTPRLDLLKQYYTKNQTPTVTGSAK